MSTHVYVAASGLGPMNKGSIVAAVLQRADRLVVSRRAAI